VVKNDPRLTIDPTAQQQTYDLAMKTGGLLETVTKAYQQINDTKKAIKTVGEFTKSLDKEQAKALQESGEALDKKLTALANKLVPERGRQGIYDRTAEATQQLSGLLGALEGMDAGPTQAAQVKYTKVKAMVDDLLKEYNQLYQTEVSTYQQKVQAANFTLFNKVEPLSGG